MEAPVIVKRTVDTQLSELAVMDAADLHADEAARGVDDPHSPRQAARRVCRSQGEQPRAARHGDALTGGGDRSTYRADRRAREDHSGRRERDRGGGEHEREHEECDAHMRGCAATG